MKLPTIREYFFTFIALKSALKPKKDRLAEKPMDFLVHCCMLNYQGVDLNNFEELWDNCKDLPYITTRNSLSGYKLTLAVKSWIKSKRDSFNLPRALDIKSEGGYMLILNANEDRAKTKKLTFKIEPFYEFED